MNILSSGMTWLDEPGGLNRYYFDSMKSLGVRNKVTGFVSDSGHREWTYGLAAVNSISGKGLELWRQSRLSVSAAKRTAKYDVYNPHFVLLTFPTIRMISAQTVPIVMNFHGPWHLEMKAEGYPHWKVSIAKRIEQYVYRHVDAFIVLSNGFKKILVDVFSIDEDRIHVIPPGVDLEKFTLPKESLTIMRERWGLSSEDFVILSVRRLRHRMGLEHLIKAAGDIRVDNKSVKLLIAGSGPILQELQEISARSSNPEACRFLGRVSDTELVELYQLSNLTVMPSIALEGFGLIAIESLACGTPVLMSRIGGSSEILEPLTSELILDKIDTDSLKSRLRKIIQHENLLPSAEECRHFAERLFAWDGVTVRIEEVFHQTKARSRSRSAVGIF